jgi:hypothetical protein
MHVSFGMRYSSRVGNEEDKRNELSRSGLCVDCQHARQIDSARASTFIFCALSLSDPAFPKYPRLPVLECSGYSPRN